MRKRRKIGCFTKRIIQIFFFCVGDVVLRYMVVVGFSKSLSSHTNASLVCIVNDWTSLCYFKNRFMLVILLTPLRIRLSFFFILSFCCFDTFDTRGMITKQQNNDVCHNALIKRQNHTYINKVIQKRSLVCTTTHKG